MSIGACYKSYISNLTLSPNLVEIKPYSFYSSDVKIIKFPANSMCEKIGKSSFAECASLENVEFPKSLKKINFRGFFHSFYTSNCHISLVLPKGLEEIGISAFMNCFELVYSVLDEGYEDIEIETKEEYNSYLKNPFNVAKKYYAGIVSVKIPSTCKKIGIQAFANRCGLNSVILSEGVEIIEQEAFYNCWYPFSYRGVNIELLKEKKYSYENYLYLLDDFNYNDFETYYQNVGLTSIKLPSSCKYIGDSAFEECHLLDLVNIPDNLEYMGKDAFAGCFIGNIELSYNSKWFSSKLNIFGENEGIELKTLTTPNNPVAIYLISKTKNDIKQIKFKGSEDEFLISELYNSISSNLGKIKIEFLDGASDIDWTENGSDKIDFASFEI